MMKSVKHLMKYLLCGECDLMKRLVYSSKDHSAINPETKTIDIAIFEGISNNNFDVLFTPYSSDSFN